ncbi:MAG: hypothetical protein HDS23_07985 [Bacteroides sp.]|nr:hypothetical protein [Bacteroides sp.]
MINKINEMMAEIQALSASTPEEVEQIRIKYLSKKGAISLLMNDFRSIPADMKREVGQKLNELKNAANDRLAELRVHLPALFAQHLHQIAVIDIQDRLIGDPVKILIQEHRVPAAEGAGLHQPRRVGGVELGGDVGEADPVTGALLHPVRHTPVDHGSRRQTEQQGSAKHARQRQGRQGPRSALPPHGSTSASSITVTSGRMLEAKMS